jgi:acyl-CoA synthetase (AMP-forming)/AMP-acid ligase II
VTLDALLFGDAFAPGDLAVSADDVRTTVAELRARADEVAALVREAGAGPGAAVVVMLPNGVDLVATLFGVWRAGGVYVPLNPRLTGPELANVLRSVNPAVLVTTSELRPVVVDLPTVLLDAGVDPVVEPRAGAAPDTPPATFDPDVALVQFTSGTTGRPKPVLLRHDGVLELLDGVIGTVRGRSAGKDPAPSPMPNLVPVSLSLWAGIYQVLFAFRVGAPVVLMATFETARFASLVREFGIRSTVLPPAAMTMLCDDLDVTDLSPLRYVRSISAPLSPLQAHRFRDQFGIAILNGWGQTEIGGEIVGWSGADAKEWGTEKLGSVGRPHRDVSVRAVDEEGNTQPAGEPGELWVLTPALSAGYADGTDLGDRLSPDGWFRTGDVGRVDEDGFVWIEGRVSDMINRGGLKVFPDEVAEVLRLSPAVADAAVVGAPDARLGEVPWAFVVASEPSSPPTVAELDELSRRHLAPYKVPARYELIAELPRNEVGKVLGKDLVRLATEGGT